jgi:hypothetical protein
MGNSIQVLSPIVQWIFVIITVYAAWGAYLTVNPMNQYYGYAVIGVAIILILLLLNPQIARARAKATFTTS